MAPKPTWLSALSSRWPESLIEAWALGMFMVCASLLTLWFERPGSVLNHAIPNSDVRRGLIGLATGVTAILLIYSPWGKRSGAHMNPAVTLAFLSLGRIEPRTAVFYVFAQFVGGSLGVILVWSLYGEAFAAPPIAFIATQPGRGGVFVAFAAEMVTSLAMMFAMLHVSRSARWSRYTGIVAGLLVASFITLEAPLSGMSINPARTFASALPGRMWHAIWIYFSAPVLGMWIGTRLYGVTGPKDGCARLSTHSLIFPCIHCGYTP